MATSKPGTAPAFFKNAAEFRRWLTKHAASATELVVGYRTVASGLPSMTWPESVDEALCVGWIDGVRKNVDATSYQIRFTPRKPGSVWSAVNIAKAEKLIAEGRMQPAGLAAFERRLAHKSRVYAYEQPVVAALTAAELKAFQRHPAAWAYFEAAPAGYRKRMLHWVCTAKKAETRGKRFEVLVGACGEGKRL
jgi:uncharacterized protein YdeI (YjbR/CyaY-like superfamily)